MKIFFDTSAFAKRYIVESGSDSVDELTEKASEIGLCIICIPEIISAFCRLKREEKITKNTFNQLSETFFADIEDAIICQLIPDTLKISYELLEKNPLRAMDALHIASAHMWKCDLFASADLRQLAAAKSLSLPIRQV